MGRIESAQGNRTLMEGDVPALPVELARLNSPVGVHVGKGSVVLRRPIYERDYW